MVSWVSIRFNCAWSFPLCSGYGGRGHIVDIEKLSVAERRKYDLGYERFHANEYVSNLIPIRRKIKHVLEPEWVRACRKKAVTDIQGISHAVPWVTLWCALCIALSQQEHGSPHYKNCFVTTGTVPSLKVPFSHNRYCSLTTSIVPSLQVLFPHDWYSSLTTGAVPSL